MEILLLYYWIIMFILLPLAAIPYQMSLKELLSEAIIMLSRAITFVKWTTGGYTSMTPVVATQ